MKRKKWTRNLPLYLLATMNLVYAMQHGFSWITYVALGLAVLVLAWDIWEVIVKDAK